MKKFCKFLREHAMKIINFKKKKNEIIHKRAAGNIKMQKICFICKEKFKIKYLKHKKYR